MSVTDDFITKLMTNYQFWAETLFKIRDKSNNLVPLILNEVQLAIGKVEEELLRTIGEARIYVLKARQGGVSTDQQARSFHKIWSTPGAMALTLAHTRDDTDKLFQISRRAVQNFVPELLPTMGRSEAKEISFPGIDTHFWTESAGSKRVGKGITLTRVHGSEFAFWEFPRAVLGSITPALIPRGSVCTLETTPDRYGSEAHEFWQEAVAGTNAYRALFFPWWKCDEKFYRLPLFEPDELGQLDDEEKELVKKEHLDHEQIKWRRNKTKEVGKTMFMSQYPEDPETCWITGGNKFYDADMIQSLLRKAPVPIQVLMGGRLKIFANPTYHNGLGIVTERVVIGSDVSEGTSGDRSGWVARGFPSWRLLAQFVDNKTEPDALADMLYEWGMNKYGEALLVIEKNFHGITVLRRLRNHWKYPLRSLYHRTPLATNFDVKTDYIGWTTTGESKPLMLDYGRMILRSSAEGYIGVPSREMLIDAWAVTDGVLTGRDVLVSEILAWVGREYVAKRKISVARPIHW